MAPGRERLGFVLGFAAISCFALTLPMTRLAVTELDPVFVALGRAFVAACAASLILLFQRAILPARQDIGRLVLVGLCVTVLFPIFISFAMRFLPASHGAVVIGLLPMATAVCMKLMDHEHPSQLFWLLSILGASTVVGFAFMKSGGVVHWADIWLLGAVAVGALGYAHGAVLAKKMGGGRVMCWALVYMMPVLALVTGLKLIQMDCARVSFSVWGAFFYLSLISQLSAMMLWYKALSMGSVVKIGQVQLLQPFLTIFFAAAFFDERVDALTIIAAVAVVFLIQLSRRTEVRLN